MKVIQVLLSSVYISVVTGMNDCPFDIHMMGGGMSAEEIDFAHDVLARFLDNDEDGCADDVDVVAQLRSSTEMIELEAGMTQSQVCQKIISFVFDNGLAPRYGDKWGKQEPGPGNKDSSKIEDAMDEARYGHFDQTPKTYPEQAIFKNTDPDCMYACQVSRFYYLSITSFLGGQEDNAEALADEWRAPSKEALHSVVPLMYNLLSMDNDMKVMSPQGVLPMSYKATNGTNTCPGGCGLDGSKECDTFSDDAIPADNGGTDDFGDDTIWGTDDDTLKAHGDDDNDADDTGDDDSDDDTLKKHGDDDTGDDDAGDDDTDDADDAFNLLW